MPTRRTRCARPGAPPGDPSAVDSDSTSVPITAGGGHRTQPQYLLPQVRWHRPLPRRIRRGAPVGSMRGEILPKSRLRSTRSRRQIAPYVTRLRLPPTLVRDHPGCLARWSSARATVKRPRWSGPLSPWARAGPSFACGAPAPAPQVSFTQMAPGVSPPRRLVVGPGVSIPRVPLEPDRSRECMHASPLGRPSSAACAVSRRRIVSPAPATGKTTREVSVTAEPIRPGDYARISSMNPSRHRGRTALVIDVEGGTATVRVSTVRTFAVPVADLRRVADRVRR